MTAIRALTGIIERPTHIERFLQHRSPVIVGVAVSASQHGLVGVAEILIDSRRDILRESAATIDGIVHVNSNTAVIHQQGNSLNLLLRRVVADLIGHVVPVVGGLTEIGSQRAEARVVVGVATRAFQGMVPILHHLAHGSGNAASIDTATRATRGLRAEVVVW